MILEYGEEGTATLVTGAVERCSCPPGEQGKTGTQVVCGPPVNHPVVLSDYCSGMIFLLVFFIPVFVSVILNQLNKTLTHRFLGFLAL